MKGVSKETTDPKQTFYDDQQIQLLLEAFDKEPIMYRTMGYLFVDTGIRRSELTGLKWENVNLIEGTIHIKEQRQHVSDYGGEVTKKPKTHKGIRTIHLSDYVKEMLKEYRQYQLENHLKFRDIWVDGDYVFTHDDGKPIYPNRPYQWLVSLTEKYGLPKISVHGLRHTHATLLVAENTDIPTISKRLGHANSGITDNYIHQLESRDKGVAEKMSAFYNKKSNHKKVRL